MPCNRLRGLVIGVTFAASVAACGGAAATSAPAATTAATTTAATAAASVTTTTSTTAGSTLVRVSANTATAEEITTALQAAGVPNADRWTREVMEYRPYDTNDPTLQSLQDNLAKYNPSAETLQAILRALKP